MLSTDRALRHDRALALTADAPTLVPIVRTSTFIDYESLSESDITACDQQIDEFRKSGQITCPTRNSYFKLMVVLRERRRVLALDGELEEAAELDVLMREISDFFIENKLYTAKAERVELHQRQCDTEAQRLAELEVKWRADQIALNQRRQAAQRRVSEDAATFLRNYDRSFPERLPPEFTRLSADLLDLRDRERHLILSRRFDEAAQLHKEFERRQRQELVKRREEYFEHCEKERAEIERRNARRRASVSAHWGNRVDLFAYRMQGELQALRNGVSHLTAKVAASKAEYIGEDDRILRDDSYLAEVRDGGNVYRRTTSLARSIVPRTLTTARREITRPCPRTTTQRLSEAEYRQSAQTPWRIHKQGR
jgi:hypothetical protein